MQEHIQADPGGVGFGATRGRVVVVACSESARRAVAGRLGMVRGGEATCLRAVWVELKTVPRFLERQLAASSVKTGPRNEEGAEPARALTAGEIDSINAELLTLGDEQRSMMPEDVDEAIAERLIEEERVTLPMLEAVTGAGLIFARDDDTEIDWDDLEGGTGCWSRGLVPWENVACLGARMRS